MNCPICQSSNTSKQRQAARQQEVLDIYHCKECDHRFQDSAQYRDIYSTGDFTIEARNQSEAPSTEKIKALDKKALERVGFYDSIIRPWPNVLEVGSSIGSFLHLLKIQGKEITGIEPDPVYSDYAQQQYFFQQHATLLEDFKAPQKYQGVCSFHVIEHVQDPRVFVDKIHQLLDDRGEVLIECPSWEIHSFGSIAHTLWAPHIHYFSHASMYRLMSESFEVLNYGFLGIALYIHARKTQQSTFDAKVLKRLKRRSRRFFNLNRLIPRIKLTSGNFPLTSTQLLLQPFLQKTVKASWQKLVTAGSFAPKEWWYRQQESGFIASKRAVHLSYYSGWENAGDTVLSKCVRDAFKQLPAQKWLLRKVTAPVTDKLIREINAGPFLLIGGGGLLLPDSNPNSKSGWQWAVSAEELDRITVPIIVYAIGYNYFPGQRPNDLFIKSLIKIVEKSTFFGLRNLGSINAVKQLIPTSLHHKIRHQPCPTTLVRRFEPTLPSKKSTKSIAINVAYDRYKNRFGAHIYTILDQMALAMKALEKRGYTIYNACHLKDDGKFELSLDRHSINYKSVNLQFAVPATVYKFYNQMDLVLGLRGHAQMIPFGVNCKIISLGSHNKLRYFLEDIEATDWFVDLKSTPENICERILATFDAIYEDEQATGLRLQNAQEQLYKITSENMQEIKQSLH